MISVKTVNNVIDAFPIGLYAQPDVLTPEENDILISKVYQLRLLPSNRATAFSIWFNLLNISLISLSLLLLIFDSTIKKADAAAPIMAACISGIFFKL